jgi:hypothetical protein
VGVFLESLRRSDACHLVEQTEVGFAIVRKDAEHVQAFNELARETLRLSGGDYVAFPRTDGPAGYDQVFVIPLD